MRIELICTGAELIDGRQRDGNTQMLAKILRREGLSIARTQVVGDGIEEIADALTVALQKSDVVICSGGLGPTIDDRTRDAAAIVFAAPLIEDEPAVEELRQKFASFGRRMKENNRRQCQFPQGAQVMPNPVGTAPGFVCEKDGRIALFGPGVPHEIELMTREQILPRILARMSDRAAVESVTLKTYGHTEGGLDELLNQIDFGDVDLAFTATIPEEIHVTLTAQAPDREQARAKIRRARAEVEKLIADSIITDDDRTLEEVIAALIGAKGLTLATAESCTGGMIASRLTNVPGSSQWFREGAVTYSNEAKMRQLGVKRQTLDEHGAVSEQTAMEMAAGIRERAGADLGLSVTGIAGPAGGSKDKPVGTVHFALAHPEGVIAWHHLFWGGRLRIRSLSTQTALDRLRRFLQSWPT